MRTAFVQGKSGSCEDLICTTPDLIAVIDGVSDKTGMTYTSSVSGEEISSGRFAAEAVAASLSEARFSDPDLVIDEVSNVLDGAVQAARGDLPPQDRPGAVFLAFQPSTGLLFGVGDCSAAWMEGSSVREHQPEKSLDRLTGLMRSAVIAAAEWDGTGEDPGRAAILPLLRRQAVFANRYGEWGYGVVNGTPVPPQYRIVKHIDADRLVLATDGYPQIVFDGSPNFEAAERHLAALLVRDPMCVSELRSTKMPRPGDVSFDDRAWLEIERS